MAAPNSEELNSLKTKFSVKNFITELPNMLNNAFTTLCNCILDFYIPEERKIKCDKASIGTIEATTIVVQNLSVKGQNAQYNYANLPDIVRELQRKVEELYPETMDDINAMRNRDVVMSKSEYDQISPKDPSTFYYVYQEELHP